MPQQEAAPPAQPPERDAPPAPGPIQPDGSQAPARNPRSACLLCVPLAAAVTALALQWMLATLPMFAAPILFPEQILDDAYMFWRYADRLWSEGRICWNPGGPATYGATSLVHLAWVFVVHGLIPGDPSRTMTWASLAPALLFLPAWAWVCVRVDRGGGVSKWACALAFLLVVRALCFNAILLQHGFTGMDTSLAVLFVTVGLGVGHRISARPGRLAVWVAGAWGAATYLARPDLMFFPLATFAAVGVLAREPVARRRAKQALLITVLGVVLTAAVCGLFFGTPVPLSYFAKGTSAYGATLAEAYAAARAQELWAFAGLYAALLIPAACYALLLLLVPRLARQEPFDLGVALAAAGFVVYERCFVIQIMPYYQRFYTPALPAVLWLAWRGARRAGPSLARRLAAAWTGRLAWAASAFAAVVALSTLLPWDPLGRWRDAEALPPVPSVWHSVAALRASLARGDSATFDIAAAYRARNAGYWFALDEFSQLPDDLVMATTEVGHPAAMNPRKRIVDLSGLNERELMLHGFDMQAMLVRHQPDLVYMPHPDYPELVRALREAPAFLAAYEEHTPASLGGVRFGVAVRRTSPHYESLCRIIRARRTP